jgi:predicted aminopeptidase
MTLRRCCTLSVLLLTGLLLLALAACGDLGFYRQAAQGQWDILSRRRDIRQLLADPATPPPLREKLTRVLAIRDFASRELDLPENGSYRYYADLDRPSVVWNVVATPEFSLEPVRWCFPFAGCVPYRGYYHQGDAETFADALRRKGDDVYVYGVAAYSTLGWFDDPILNTFINGPDTATAGLIFHELAHQKIYVKGDADFNEAFASTVQEAGLQLWLERSGREEEVAAYRTGLERSRDFLVLVRATREQLAALYDQPLPEARKRQEKARILAGMRQSYQQLKAQWGGYAGYDRWFATELNNARFVAVSTYQRLVPAFRELLRESKGNWPQFYSRVKELAGLTLPDRQARMQGLLIAATGHGPVRSF